MSKEQGQNIGIEFTENLIGAPFATTPKAYRYYRWSIINQHTLSDYMQISEIELYAMVSDVETLVSYGNGGGQVYSASAYYSSYTAAKAFDNSTATYWQSRTKLDGLLRTWIQVDLGSGKAVAATKFRWYVLVGTYTPKDFILQGSNDNVNWDTLLLGTSANATGWQEWALDVKEWLNADAFTISWQEPLWIEKQTNILAPLTPKSYMVQQCVVYPIADAKKILLIMDYMKRFCNVYGDITVAYNASNGDLQGVGGIVANFSYSFTPTELVEELPERWYQNENITAGVTAYTIIVAQVHYILAYETENITVGISGYSMTVTKVGSNPL